MSLNTLHLKRTRWFNPNGKRAEKPAYPGVYEVRVVIDDDDDDAGPYCFKRYDPERDQWGIVAHTPEAAARARRITVPPAAWRGVRS